MHASLSSPNCIYDDDELESREIANEFGDLVGPPTGGRVTPASARSRLNSQNMSRHRGPRHFDQNLHLLYEDRRFLIIIFAQFLLG